MNWSDDFRLVWEAAMSTSNTSAASSCGHPLANFDLAMRLVILRQTATRPLNHILGRRDVSRKSNVRKAWLDRSKMFDDKDAGTTRRSFIKAANQKDVVDAD